MKAVAVFPAARAARVVEHLEPYIEQDSQVKMRLLEVGVCGTDREIAAFDYGTPPAGADYLVIGHESLAEVVEVGKNVTRVKVGDLVVPMVRASVFTRRLHGVSGGATRFLFYGRL